MPLVSNASSICDGACGHPPSIVSTYSSDVFSNNLGVVRQSDVFTTHPDGFHGGRTVSGGSGTVFVNNREIARIGDDISCGAHIATGSNNVFAGG